MRETPESGTVLVQFFGICTHFHESALMPVPQTWTHRVVLVNASDPARLGHRLPELVAPHVARLQIRVEDLLHPVEARPWFPISYADKEKVEWKLEGVTLQVADLIPPLSQPLPPPACIPSLQACTTQDPISVPGDFVIESLPSEVSCYFDFDKEISIESGKLKTGAAIALITANSADPGITITKFGDGEEPVVLRVKPESPITISNIPEDPHTEKHHDFRLHYLTLQSFPEGFRAVDTKMCPDLQPNNPPRKISDFSTPECSNSNYP